MTSHVTLRLDKKTRGRIFRVADRERVSASNIIREAIQAWLDQHESPQSPYESVADLLGAVHGRDPRRSIDSGRRFAELLRQRKRSS